MRSSVRAGWKRGVVAGGALAALSLLATVGWAQDATPTKITLKECLDRAFEANYDLKRAVAAAEGAHGSAVSTWAGILPRVDIGLAKSRTEQRREVTFINGVAVQTGSVINNRNNLFANIAANLIAPETWYGRSAGAKEWDSAQYGISASTQNVGIDVITRFLELVRAERNHDLAQENLNLSEDQLRKTDALFELGAVPKADVLESKVSVSQAQRDVIRAQNDYVVAQGQLNLAIGDPVNNDIQPDYPGVTVDEITQQQADLVQLALSRRPDVIESEIAYESAKAARKSASWAVWPALSGRLFYDRDAVRFSDTFDADLNDQASWGWSVSLNWPIFDGLVTKGRKIRASGTLVDAREALAQRQQLVAFEVRQTMLLLDSAKASLEVSKDEIAAAEENLRLREAMYDHGAATILELIEARVGLTNALFDQISADTALQLAWFNFLVATGVDVTTGKPFVVPED